jgi:hypothetical protein
MARRAKTAKAVPVRRSDDWIFPSVKADAQVESDTSLLDVVDNVLNKGVVLNGDLILGVANVDLIYAKLSVLLAALDRIMGEPPPRDTATAPPPRKRAARKRPSRRK